MLDVKIVFLIFNFEHYERFLTFQASRIEKKADILVNNFAKTVLCRIEGGACDGLLGPWAQCE